MFQFTQSGYSCCWAVSRGWKDRHILNDANQCISKFLISCSFSFNYKKTSLYHLPIGKFAFFCGIPRKRFETCCFCTSTSIFFFQFLHIYPICSIGPSENVNCMYFYSAKRALKISLINGDRPIKCLEFINLNLVAIPGIMYCTNVEVT